MGSPEERGGGGEKLHVNPEVIVLHVTSTQKDSNHTAKMLPSTKTQHPRVLVVYATGEALPLASGQYLLQTLPFVTNCAGMVLTVAKVAQGWQAVTRSTWHAAQPTPCSGAQHLSVHPPCPPCERALCRSPAPAGCQSRMSPCSWSAPACGERQGGNNGA